MDELKTIHSLYECCKTNNDSAIESIIEREDLEDVCTTVYNGYFDGNVELADLSRIIDILSYLENETSIPSPVSDTLYDKILETLGDSSIINIGTDEDVVDTGDVREHKYPELRGSLQKVHFVKEADIPNKDSRRSLEDALTKALSYFDISPRNMVEIYCDYKWDGASNVFECHGNELDHVLTRYKVALNLGKDITYVYQGKTPSELFGNRIPAQFYEFGEWEYGVKTEIIMKQEKFEKYKEYMMDKKCNRRSAVSSILNRTSDNFDPRLLEFIEIIPLQISSGKPIDGDPDIIFCDNMTWHRVGLFNGRIQYISTYMQQNNVTLVSNLGYNMTTTTLAEGLYEFRSGIEKDAQSRGYPIDGMVITLLNDDLVHQLGRSNHKNNFQIAYKFPAGMKKTILKDVQFQVGPIAGTITPVAEVEPVVINGNTISSVSLSNLDKLERLNLHEKEEVTILYDIIPKIVVDLEYDKEYTGPKIEVIYNCPICHEPLSSGRCTNPNCDAKIAGRISAYTKKMNIPYYGVETIQDLVNRGMLTSIGGLYKMSLFRNELMKIPGYQDKRIANLIQAPFSRTTVYPHELLGSIGIPDISLATMEKVCRAVNVMQLISEPACLLSMYHEIKGIGDITAKKIVDGLNTHKTLIMELIPYFAFKSYTTLYGKNVVFTGIRDWEFSEFLNDKYGITTSGSVNKNTMVVITPEKMTDTSGKIKSAKEKEIPILTIVEAKDRWGYH